MKKKANYCVKFTRYRNLDHVNGALFGDRSIGKEYGIIEKINLAFPVL
jgi:hypothetical protein